MSTILTQPSAGPVIHALRSIGYNAKTAIADLVDNCIDAKASQVDLSFEYERNDGMIKIMDNGIGMDERTLQQAMNIGSKDPRVAREPSELGRFGMGLKTASFSLGKRLSVLTKRCGVYYERCWDLNFVSECNEWQLFTFIPLEVRKRMGEIPGDSGTIVCIDKLDRFMGAGTGKTIQEKSFFSKVSRLCNHLGFVFHSLLNESEFMIRVNGNTIDAWDPFLSQNGFTREGSRQKITINGVAIRVKSYVLPHASHLTKQEYDQAGGPKGWRDQQGFYIYRENRLLHYGDWLNLFPKDGSSQLARIRIDLPNIADEEWQVDIKKSTVIPPEEAKERLKSIARVARSHSKNVFYFRTQGSNSSLKFKGSLSTWEQSPDEDGLQFILNRNHPLVNEILNRIDNETARMLNTYLKLVQLGSPSNIIAVPKVNEQVIQQYTDAERELILQLAQFYQEKGYVKDEEQLLNILLAQPSMDRFNRRTMQHILREGLVQ